MDDKAKDAAAALPAAPAMDGKNLLPVSTGDTRRRRGMHAPFPAVLLVCLWSLVSAGLCTTMAAIFNSDDQTDCPTPIVNKSLWWSECYELTGSNDVAARALLHGLTRGSVPQAALAVLALLLAARRRVARRALALATLAVTVTNHCMLAWFAGLLFVGTSGDALGILLVAVVGAYVFLAAVLALFFFVALVLGGDLVD